MPELPIPTFADEITADWLQAALATAEIDGELTAVQLRPIGTGQMATSRRVTLEWAGSDSGLPASVVLKTPSDEAASREAGARGAYLREVRFYQELSDQLAICTPTMFYGEIDESTNDFALLLEDLHPAVQGDQIAGCSVEQARLAVRDVAGLHGPTWCDPSLQSLRWLVPSPSDIAEERAQLQELFVMFTEGFIARYEGRIEADHVELLTWFAARAGGWFELSPDRVALRHADYRLDNLLFGTKEGGHAVTAVDWQTVGVSNPLVDVAYLLGTSLEPALRRQVESELVTDYHSALLDFGVTEYPLELCLEDYAAQSFHALLITVLGSMMTGQTPRGDDMFMAMLRRSATQIADLDARRFLA